MLGALHHTMPPDQTTMPVGEADDSLRPNALGLIPLERVCPLLGLSWVVARRKHALGTLPVRAFRLNDSRRGPLWVHIDDLERYVAKRRSRGHPAHQPKEDA